MLTVKLFIVFFCLGTVASSERDDKDKLWLLLRRVVKLLKESKKEVVSRNTLTPNTDIPENIQPVVPDPFVEKEKRDIGKRAAPTLIEFSDSLKTLILNMHNEARANAVPIPVPALENMEWDDSLADIAAGWATKCTWGHNPNRSDSVDGYVGENIAVFTDRSDADVIKDSMNGFINEKNFYDYNTNTCNPGEQCAHYTQIVWKQSVKVGCVLAFCPEFHNAQGFCNSKYLVCNYFYGGNWNGYKPYQTS